MFKKIQKKFDMHEQFCNIARTHRTTNNKNMRTKTLILTAALAAAGIATSKAQTVFSVNAVGFVNVPLTPGYNLFCNPLNATNNSIQSLITALPNGTLLLTWNSAIQDFNSDTFLDRKSVV